MQRQNLKQKNSKLNCSFSCNGVNYYFLFFWQKHKFCCKRCSGCRLVRCPILFPPFVDCCNQMWTCHVSLFSYFSNEHAIRWACKFVLRKCQTESFLNQTSTKIFQISFNKHVVNSFSKAKGKIFLKPNLSYVNII